MAEKKILTLHLADEWYQKILSGEKTEEYRECSVFWAMRLLRKDIPNRADVIAGVAKTHHLSKENGLVIFGVEVMPIISIHGLQHFLRLCGCEELKIPQSLLKD